MWEYKLHRSMTNIWRFLHLTLQLLKAAWIRKNPKKDKSYCGGFYYQRRQNTMKYEGITAKTMAFKFDLLSICLWKVIGNLFQWS